MENFDERIQKLTERHEALTARHEALAQTVELIAHETFKNATSIAALNTAASLFLQIVQSHEQRLNRLEGGK